MLSLPTAGTAVPQVTFVLLATQLAGPLSSRATYYSVASQHTAPSHADSLWLSSELGVMHVYIKTHVLRVAPDFQCVTFAP